MAKARPSPSNQSKPKSISIQLPPVGAKCQEASPVSIKTYIPCGKPATRLIRSEDHSQVPNAAWTMCEACASHSVKNRGMKLVEQGEPWTAVSVPAPTPEAILENLKAINEPVAYQLYPPASDLPNTVDPALLVDVEADPEGPTDEQRRQVTVSAKEAMRLQDEIAALQAQINTRAERLSLILENELPAAMKIIGQTKVPLIGGAEIQLADIVRASILVDNRDTAHRWLEKNGGEPLVKRKITIEFGMGEQAWAKKFMRDMEQRKKKLHATFTEAVHPGSLTKFVKEKKAAGKDIDTSINIYEATVAEIKRPKDNGAPVEGM